MTRNGEVGKRIPSVLTRPSWMRVNGFGYSKKRVLKNWFWWWSTMMVLCSTRQPIQTIRSRLALGGMERGTCSLRFPKLRLSLTWIWECICLLGMLTVPFITWTEKRTTMPTIWLNWRKSCQILPMEMLVSSLRCGWMVLEAKGPRRSTMSLRLGLKLFVTCRAIVWFSQLKGPVSAGLEMNEATQGNPCGKKSSQTS